MKKELMQVSILDRLLDESPGVTVEAEKSKYKQLKDLRNSVRRDLEALLNSRHRTLSPPENFEQLQTSLLNYGLPDLATINIRSEESKEKFIRSLEKLLKDFEPRFKSIKITFLENSDEVDRTLRFRVNATLYADPVPEVVVFDSIMEPISRTVNVKESQYV